MRLWKEGAALATVTAPRSRKGSRGEKLTRWQGKFWTMSEAPLSRSSSAMLGGGFFAPHTPFVFPLPTYV